MSAAAEDEARQGGPAFEAVRWLLEDALLTYSGGRTWVFTRLWGTDTEQAMRTWLAKYPEARVKVERGSSRR